MTWRKREIALRMALEYLEASDNYLGSLDHSEPIAAIKEALAHLEPEPVAKVAEIHLSRYTIEWVNGPLPEGTPLYTQPKE